MTTTRGVPAGDGATNTRIRDYADIYTLTGRHDLGHAAVRTAFLATTRLPRDFADPLARENGHLSWSASDRRWSDEPAA